MIINAYQLVQKGLKLIKIFVKSVMCRIVRIVLRTSKNAWNVQKKKFCLKTYNAWINARIITYKTLKINA